MATSKKTPAKVPTKKGPGRPQEGKEDWQVAGYRLPPGLRDSIRAAFYRAAGAEQVRFSINVKMDKPPSSMNEFVAAILDAASRSI